jgi:hypothetical protein
MSTELENVIKDIRGIQADANFEIDKVVARISKPAPKTPWEPDDIYWYLGTDGVVFKSSRKISPDTYQQRKARGNVYRTKALAVAADARSFAKHKVTARIAELDFEHDADTVDWRNRAQFKYMPSIDHRQGQLRIDAWSRSQLCGIEFISTRRETIEQVFTELEPEIRLMWGAVL